MGLQCLAKIIENQKITKDIYQLILEGNFVKKIEQPGQFVHLLIPSQKTFLRRPFSLASYHQDKNQCTILYKILGTGTKELAQLTKGTSISLLGPLGNGFFVNPLYEKVLLIGGGIGIPPLYELGKEFQKKGTEVTFLLGYRNQEEVFYQEEFAKLGTVITYTEDGSFGHQGRIDAAFPTLEKDWDAIYSCGPTPMLKAIKETFSNQYPTYLSLEERMACGFGVCYGCVVAQTKGKTPLKVCQDGPVFLATEVEL